MFAVIETGGKQYHIKSGDVLKIEKVNTPVGDKIHFDKVLNIGTKIGCPVIEGATVVGEVIKHFKNDKVIVFKKKRRQNYRRKRGHRQHLTLIKITDIKE